MRVTEVRINDNEGYRGTYQRYTALTFRELGSEGLEPLGVLQKLNNFSHFLFGLFYLQIHSKQKTIVNINSKQYIYTQKIVLANYCIRGSLNQLLLLDVL